MSEAPVPFDRTLDRLLPVADAVMTLMLSRPSSGSLRDTRVTLVTIGLAASTALACTLLGAIGALLAAGGASSLWWPAAFVLLAFGAASADLAWYGVHQRRLEAGRD
jgi:hypothetical protein